MARTITFQPTAQTNFSDGNQMFSDAIKNMGLAFNKADAVVNDFGQAVRERNNAVLNSFINNISRDDWNKPETQVALHNMIKDVATNTSNMVDYGKVFDTIDKRQGVLTDRHNAQLENQVNGLVAQTKQDAYDANNLYNLGKFLNGLEPTNPHFTKTQTQYRDALSSANPTVINSANDKAVQSLIDDQKKATELNDANFGLQRSTEQFHLNTANALANQLYDATRVLNNPNATEEQKTQANQVVNSLKSAIDKLPLSQNTKAGIIDGAMSKGKERDQKQANIDRDYNLKETATHADIRQGDMNANANVFRALSGGNSNDSGGSGSEKLSPSEKELDKLGLLGYVKDGTLSSPQIGNAMVVQLENIHKQELARDNKISFDSWIVGKGKKYKEQINSQGTWFNKMLGYTHRYDDIVKNFPKDATEYEKQQIVAHLADPDSPYARYAQSNDTPQNAINNVLRGIRLGRQAEIQALQREKFNEILTHLATVTGMPREAVYGAIIKPDPNVGWDAPTWFVNADPNLRDSFVAQVRGKKPSNNKTNQQSNAKRVDEAIKNTVPKKEVMTGNWSSLNNPSGF